MRRSWSCFDTNTTVRLIEYCQRLDDEHLDATIPGTYGTIRETLRHLVESSEREVTTTDGWRVPGAVPMAQAMHHANDHRSHIMSILGARGLDVPEPNGLDLWGYAEATDQMQEM